MSRSRRLALYLLLNVIVSALTVSAVLWLWTRANPLPSAEVPTPAAPAEQPGITTQESGSDEPQAGDTTDESQQAPVNLAGQLEIATIIGAGDLENEKVLVRHVGDLELDLAGWQLQDEDGNTFVFPSLTMFPGGAVTIFTQSGANTVVDLYWGLDEASWSVGEQASLLDPSGNVQATYSVP